MGAIVVASMFHFNFLAYFSLTFIVTITSTFIANTMFTRTIVTVINVRIVAVMTNLNNMRHSRFYDKYFLSTRNVYNLATPHYRNWLLNLKSNWLNMTHLLLLWITHLSCSIACRLSLGISHLWLPILLLLLITHLLLLGIALHLWVTGLTLYRLLGITSLHLGLLRISTLRSTRIYLRLLLRVATVLLRRVTLSRWVLLIAL